MSYWLSEWLDRLEIDTDEQLNRAIRDDAVVDLALELAESRIGTPIEFSSAPGRVVAGRRLDLSGILSCGGAACLEREVDQLFSSFGYYFDRVIVEGLTPGRFLSRVRTDTEKRGLVRVTLRTHAHIFLLLDRIGASQYLDFGAKPYVNCGDHYREHAEELGLSALLDKELERKVMAFLLKEGDVRSEQAGDLVAHVFSLPFEEEDWVHWQKPDARQPTLEDAAKSWVVAHSLGVIGDLALADRLKVPLAATADRLLDLSASQLRPLTPDDVAVSLQLPVLTGLPAAEIIKAREDDRDHFIKFREALAMAIRERIVVGDADTPADVAAKVIREYVEPAVANIGVRLQAASKSFGRKTMNHVGIASVMTSIGLLSGMPLLVAGGVAAFSGLGMHANQLADEKKDIELSDMYFLWNIKKQHGAHT